MSHHTYLTYYWSAESRQCDIVLRSMGWRITNLNLYSHEIGFIGACLCLYFTFYIASNLCVSVSVILSNYS